MPWKNIWGRNWILKQKFLSKNFASNTKLKCGNNMTESQESIWVLPFENLINARSAAYVERCLTLVMRWDQGIFFCLKGYV